MIADRPVAILAAMGPARLSCKRFGPGAHGLAEAVGRCDRKQNGRWILPVGKWNLPVGKGNRNAASPRSVMLPLSFWAQQGEWRRRSPMSATRPARSCAPTSRGGPTPRDCARSWARKPRPRDPSTLRRLPLPTRTRACCRSPTIRAPASCRSATWEIPNRPRLLAIALLCLRFPRQCGTGPNPIRAHPA